MFSLSPLLLSPYGTWVQITLRWKRALLTIPHCSLLPLVCLCHLRCYQAAKCSTKQLLWTSHLMKEAEAVIIPRGANKFLCTQQGHTPSQRLPKKSPPPRLSQATLPLDALSLISDCNGMLARNSCQDLDSLGEFHRLFGDKIWASSKNALPWKDYEKTCSCWRSVKLYSDLKE